MDIYLKEGRFKALPKTTEEATRRYLHHYERCFSGCASDLIRLKGTAEGFIHQLRKVAPKFYEEKLPTLINQAASTLLTFNTNIPEQAEKFHRTHAAFLTILSDLQHSQPAGEVNFQQERDRIQERTKLLKRQIELRKEIDELMASEIVADELGEEEEDSLSYKILSKLDQLKNEEKRVAVEIAHMDGMNLVEEARFELKVPKGTTLSRLKPEQLKLLEEQMLEFVKHNNRKKNAIYVDKSIIDSMIEKLNIDQALFTKVEISEMSKNALDAYKSFFREIDYEQRNEYFDELLANKRLLPREGKILSHPDDVPEDIKQKLDESASRLKRKVDDVVEEFSKRPCTDDAQADNIEDDDGLEDDIEKIVNTVRQKTVQYARIKEEPRDDYVADTDSGEEIFVNEQLAESIVDGKTIKYVEEKRQPQELVETNGAHSDNSSDERHDQETNMDDDDDDDIECLGTIEPSDKVKTVFVD